MKPTTLSPIEHARKVMEKLNEESYHYGGIKTAATAEPVCEALKQQRAAGMYDVYCELTRYCEEAHWTYRWLLNLTVKRYLKERRASF